MTVSRRLFLGVTGASGAIYAQRFLQIAVSHYDRVYLVATKNGLEVARHELQSSEQSSLLNLFKSETMEIEKIKIFSNTNIFAPVASGTSAPDDMVILPCSMGTAARIAQGMSSNLIERAADVMIKERRRLFLCPRETPLSTIHLRNLTTLSELGCTIVPMMPGFYFQPKTITDLIDFNVGKVCDLLGIAHDLYKPWNNHQI